MSLAGILNTHMLAVGHDSSRFGISGSSARAVPAAHGRRFAAGRLLALRARRRQRHPEHPLPRGSADGDEWIVKRHQDVGHQRHARKPGDAAGAHRPTTGSRASWWRRTPGPGRRGPHHQPQDRQAGLQGRRDRGDVLRRPHRVPGANVLGGPRGIWARVCATRWPPLELGRVNIAAPRPWGVGQAAYDARRWRTPRSARRSGGPSSSIRAVRFMLAEMGHQAPRPPAC